MHVLFADEQVDAGYRKHDNKHNYCRRRGKRGITARIAVKHIVDITDDRVHFVRVQICSEQRNSITVRLEGTDKAGDYEVKQCG